MEVVLWPLLSHAQACTYTGKHINMPLQTHVCLHTGEHSKLCTYTCTQKTMSVWVWAQSNDICCRRYVTISKYIYFPKFSPQACKNTNVYCKRMHLCCCLAFELDFPRTFSAIKWDAYGEHRPPRCQPGTCVTWPQPTPSRKLLLRIWQFCCGTKPWATRPPQILSPKRGSPWRNWSQPSLVARLRKDTWNGKRGKEKQAG